MLFTVTPVVFDLSQQEFEHWLTNMESRAVICLIYTEIISPVSINVVSGTLGII